MRNNRILQSLNLVLLGLALTTLGWAGEPKAKPGMKLDCAQCHAEVVESFNGSHHAKSWDKKPPESCLTCHVNSHQNEGRPTALGKRSVIEDCAQCHATEADAFKASVHGQALARGVTEAPSCMTCHPAHQFKGPSDPTAAVGGANVANTCAQCHASETITGKFRLNPEVVSSFKMGFHGVAVQAGVTKAANCASCHTAHDIRSQWDPQSSVNKERLPETCGQCHPNAGKGMTQGKVHVSPRTGGGIVDWVRGFYIVLIILTLGAMLLHDLGDYTYKVFRGREQPLSEQRLYEQRMTLHERVQHIVLMASFFLLLYTGFAHTFPDAWWAAPFHSGDGPWWRRLLHFIGAGAMVILSVYHVFYLALTPRGHRLVRELMLGLGDLKDLVLTVGAWLKMCEPPLHTRQFSYPEKAEYWAMIWGTVVMTVTGVVIATRDWWMTWAPKWFIDVCLTMHYWEAILAALSILVWHFYWVFFDRYVFPMNWTWITGSIRPEPKAEAPKDEKQEGKEGK